jgi:hypothetical protein
MEKTNYMELCHFSIEHVDVLNSFELPVEQEQFTALPINYQAVTDGQYRMVILSGHEPVGFFCYTQLIE